MSERAIPADVEGRYHSRRIALSYLLIGVFLGLPWLRIGGFPAILLDIPNRRFALFGLHFWAQDVPLLFLIAATVILSVALVTALWGRIWCGWACPQTVFGDLVFRRIERLIEGDAIARRKLQANGWTSEKLTKRAAKWSVYGVLSLILSHTFLAYFVGSDALASMIRSSPAENPVAFAVMGVVFAGVMFDLCWFRERFCVLVCPYGRLQSVLHDEASRVVAYDKVRGEPRGKTTTVAPVGDCVDCGRCVRVCPTGIDIRNGLQLECVACTACVDACDAIMTKLARPTGLIRYGGGNTPSQTLVRPLTAFYLMLLLLAASGLTWNIASRLPLSVGLVRAVGEPFQVVTDEKGTETVINHFRLDVQNQTFEPQKLSLETLKPEAPTHIELVISNLPASIEPGAHVRADLFVKFAKPQLAWGSVRLALQALTASGTKTGVMEASLLAPLR